jgi:hypothetical protein
LALAGKLEGSQVEYARRFKDIEQLYDSKTDPEMIHNLADDPAYVDVLKQMRQRLHDWMIETRDLGLINERLLYECAKWPLTLGSWSGYRELRRNFSIPLTCSCSVKLAWLI